MKQTMLIILVIALVAGIYLYHLKAPDAESVSTADSETITAISASVVEAPVAKKMAHEMTIHDKTRVDNYYWMRDDSRTDKEMLAHLAKENDYKEAMLEHTKGFQETLYNEMVGRLEKDVSDVPYKEGDYWYYRRFEANNEYPIYARKKATLEAEEEVVLDVNEIAPKQGYFSASGLRLSSNQQILAYGEDFDGRRIYTIRFKNLEDGTMLDDRIEGANNNVVWANDNKTLFYIHKDPVSLLGYKVYRHTLGTPQSDDVLIYEEKDTTFYTGLSKSFDGQTLYIFHSNTTKTGQRYLDANDPTGEFVLFQPIRENVEYRFDKVGDDFYIMTNDEAINAKLMKASTETAQSPEQWEELIPNREDIQLNNFIVFNDYLAVAERDKGLTQLRIMPFETQEFNSIKFNDPAYMTGFSTNRDPSASTLRYSYSSMTTPNSVYEYDMKSGETRTLKQDKVLGDFSSDDYTSERIFITARDGAEVPVSLVYRKDLFKKDGTNPLYQYGYGSYGATIDPRFSANWVSLIDRGFVVAIAHIRGSQMLGRQWYEDGKMFTKMNTFTDFIDVTDGLVAQQYADKDKVVIVGGSAGGLLVGAVMNMAPEKYLAVAAHVPFVDVVTTMLDESIPLTTNEYSEWGNPNNEDSYDYMLSYSPYDQVKQQDYPHVLVTTGLHDSQVQYFEPMKWVAKLREYKTDDNKLLFHTNMEAGHGGASGRFRRLKQTAMEYAFFMDLLDIKE